MVRNRDAHAAGPCQRTIGSRGVRGLIQCAAAVAVLMVSAAANAELSQGSGERPIDTVTVEAARQRALLEDQLSTFAAAITTSDPDESIARWEEPICLLVAGLPSNEGRFVFQRISQVANEAGIPSGPPGCTPNLRVAMTREPEAVLKSWWSRNHRLFNKDRGVGGIKHTIDTPAPVRIFYNACSVPAEMVKGFAIRASTLCGVGGIADSRLRRATVRVLYSVIIVVDKRQTEGMDLGSLSDYIAMSSLAQIRKNPDIVGSTPTILHLFDKPDAPRPQALSPWDRAFLKALYDTDPGRVTQLAEIKYQMKRELIPIRVR